MPVTLAPINIPVRVISIAAQGSVRRHLNELGIAEGGSITLVSSSANGVIVVVKEGRLCLDGGIASKILVA